MPNKASLGLISGMLFCLLLFEALHPAGFLYPYFSQQPETPTHRKHKVPPIIGFSATVEPSITTVSTGGTRIFTLTPLGGASPYTYQWFVSGITEIVENGGFETGNFQGWQVGGNCSVTSETSYQGIYSAKLQSFDNWTAGVIEYFFTNVSVSKSNTEKFGAWVKGSGGYKYCSVRFNETMGYDIEINDTSEWVYLDILSTIPDDWELVMYFVEFNANYEGCTLYVDNLTLKTDATREQIGETSTTFAFTREDLGLYQIWSNVTDSTSTTVKSNIATCTVT